MFVNNERLPRPRTCIWLFLTNLFSFWSETFMAAGSKDLLEERGGKSDSTKAREATESSISISWYRRVQEGGCNTIDRFPMQGDEYRPTLLSQIHLRNYISARTTTTWPSLITPE